MIILKYSQSLSNYFFHLGSPNLRQSIGYGVIGPLNGIIGSPGVKQIGGGPCLKVDDIDDSDDSDDDKDGNSSLIDTSHLISAFEAVQNNAMTNITFSIFCNLRAKESF